MYHPFLGGISFSQDGLLVAGQGIHPFIVCSGRHASLEVGVTVPAVDPSKVRTIRLIADSAEFAIDVDRRMRYLELHSETTTGNPVTWLSFDLRQAVDVEFLQALVAAKKRLIICEMEGGKSRKVKVSRRNARRIDMILTIYPVIARELE